MGADKWWIEWFHRVVTIVLILALFVASIYEKPLPPSSSQPSENAPLGLDDVWQISGAQYGDPSPTTTFVMGEQQDWLVACMDESLVFRTDVRVLDIQSLLTLGGICRVPDVVQPRTMDWVADQHVDVVRGMDEDRRICVRYRLGAEQRFCDTLRGLVD